MSGIRSFIPATGKVYEVEETDALVATAHEGWLTEGPHAAGFAKKLRKYIGCRKVSLTNSGSSANFLALASLVRSGRLSPGDKVITPATGFPTTLSAILWNNLKPVFVDCEVPTYVPQRSLIAKAIADTGAKAVMAAHTLGNPFYIDECDGVYVIEDCCDALGSKFQGKKTGSIGDCGTLSFYPAHMITTGEGGAVTVNARGLYESVRQIGGWGRDCWCPTGKSNTCGKRFSHQFPDLPTGYDHKYTYSEPYAMNLKMTDMQAALGSVQMDKLDKFNEARGRNFRYLTYLLLSTGLNKYFHLPKATAESEPVWFGYPLTMKTRSFSRQKFCAALYEKGVDTRPIFAGNFLRQPLIHRLDPSQYEVYGTLHGSDQICDDSFFVGIWHGLNDWDIGKIARSFVEVLNG